MKTLKGLTLIEVVVAMAVFSILMAGATQTFTSGLMSFKQNTDIERDVESVSALMNQIAKELRTSTVSVSATNPSTLLYYDYSQSRCILYTSSSGNLTTAGTIRRRETAAGVVLSADVTTTGVAANCPIGLFGAAVDVTPADSRLNLVIDESTAGSVGGAKILFTLNSSAKPVVIQSFVSSRDYKKSGL